MKHLHIKFFLGLIIFGMSAICGCTPSVSTDIPVFHAQAEVYSTQISDTTKRLTTLLPLLAKAETLAQGYYYDEAIELLQNVPDEYTKDEEVLSKIAEKLREIKPTKYIGIINSMLDCINTNINSIDAVNMAYKTDRK